METAVKSFVADVLTIYVIDLTAVVTLNVKLDLVVFYVQTKVSHDTFILRTN